MASDKPGKTLLPTLPDIILLIIPQLVNIVCRAAIVVTMIAVKHTMARLAMLTVMMMPTVTIMLPRTHNAIEDMDSTVHCDDVRNSDLPPIDKHLSVEFCVSFLAGERQLALLSDPVDAMVEKARVEIEFSGRDGLAVGMLLLLFLLEQLALSTSTEFLEQNLSVIYST